MKNLALILLILVGVSCTQQNLSPTETAKVVVESFYKKDNKKLKEHTTADSYEAFRSIQDIMTMNTSSSSNFKVLQERVDGDVAWVQFSTVYDEQSDIFKLIKENGQWKVTEQDLREKTPF